jgi:hypothetical protein
MSLEKIEAEIKKLRRKPLWRFPYNLCGPTASKACFSPSLLIFRDPRIIA